MKNILMLSDSYKVSHYRQYPPKTEIVHSYFESRGGRFNNVTFFGLQYYIKEYLVGAVVTQEKIEQAQERIDKHLGAGLFNREGWEYILKEHNGKLPVVIKAVPEGIVTPVHSVLMTIENTDPKCFWLTNYLETLLVQVWYGCTVATQSREIKKVITEYLEKTGDPQGVSFKLHDFGFRGVSSVESAGVGGAAHLINFLGTDTMEALNIVEDYYCGDPAGIGFSIPGAEHSTITSWGKEREVDAMRNMLTAYKGSPIIACVSDSFDIYNACAEIWGNQLKEEILNLDGTLVVRPDSGDPVTVVLKVLNILWDKFGGTVNEKGYKMLDPHIRVIQGDGVNYDSIILILRAMEQDGFSIDNIAFGMGGGLLQQLDRDTQKFAFKCSSITIDGKEHDVWKDPVTDAGKASKRGRFDDLPLVEVFRDGNLIKEYTFNEVRANTLATS